MKNASDISFKFRFREIFVLLLFGLAMLPFQNCGPGLQVPDPTTPSKSESASSEAAISQNSATAQGSSGPSELNVSRQTGVVGAWRFNRSASMVTPDESTFKQNGQIVGSPVLKQGQFNGAFEFDGNDYVNLGQPSHLNFDHTLPETAYTISLWLRTTSFGSLIAKRSASVGDIQYQMFVSADGRLGAHVGGESQFILGRRRMNDGNWHHVALAVFHEGGKPYAELIVDGRTDAYEMVQGVVVNASDVWIGSRPGGFAYTGLIDEVVIFNRRLNAVQVDELY